MLRLSSFLCCMSLEFGAKVIGWFHLLLATSSVIYFSVIGFSLITHELAIAMIYCVVLCVIAFYIKLCIDLIAGASKKDLWKILRFKTTLMISLVILLLSFGWAVLSHPKRLPYKQEFVISLLVAMILEVYFFMVIDVLAQKKQEESNSANALPTN